MRRLTYTIKLEPVAEGGFVVTVPALPGCVSQGDSYDHAIEMAKEAIEGYLVVLVEDGDPIPEEPENDRPLAIGLRVEDVTDHG